MNNRNNGGPFQIVGPGNNVPIVGQPEHPLLLQTATLITPALKRKLDAWTEKKGIAQGDLGLMIMRMGLIGMSTIIDNEPDWITPGQANEFLPDKPPGQD